MNSQNKMNAGAEYVLYRIWATLQDQDGIRVESLLTCLGALAGYACQQAARRTAALPGSDPGRHALLDSPLSVWALVSRAVLKLEQPLPDIHEIVRHVAQTAESRPFDFPRAPEGHRPRYPAIVYLKQLWPQTLPIAQRFCRKPMQIPVLFGIALQRAIEHTQDRLSPTLAASIAMECAVAMMSAVLPEARTETQADLPTTGVTPAVIAPTLASNLSMTATPIRATPPRKKRIVDEESDLSATRLWSLVARIPPTVRIATLASLAFMTTAGAMYQSNPGDAPEVAQEVRQLVTPASQPNLPLLAQATPQDSPPSEEPLPSEEPPPPEEADSGPPALASNDPVAADAETSDGSLPPDDALQPASQAYAANDEGVMRDEYGQPMK